jgi:hypothetical protein
MKQYWTEPSWEPRIIHGALALWVPRQMIVENADAGKALARAFLETWQRLPGEAQGRLRWAWLKRFYKPFITLTANGSLGPGIAEVGRAGSVVRFEAFLDAMAYGPDHQEVCNSIAHELGHLHRWAEVIAKTGQGRPRHVLLKRLTAMRISTAEDELATNALAASWGFRKSFSGPGGQEKLVANRGQ